MDTWIIEFTRSFGEVQQAVAEKAGVKDIYEYMMLGPEQETFWKLLDKIAWRRCLDLDEDPSVIGTRNYHHMKMLCNHEFEGWVEMAPMPDGK